VAGPALYSAHNAAWTGAIHGRSERSVFEAFFVRFCPEKGVLRLADGKTGVIFDGQDET
jgi:hypothetical protein